MSEYSYNPSEWPSGIPNPFRSEVNIYPSYQHGSSDWMSRPYFGFPYEPQPLDVVERGLAGSNEAGGMVAGLGLSSLLIAAPLLGAGIGAIASKFASDTKGSDTERMKSGALAGAVIGGMAIFIFGLIAAGGGALTGVLSQKGQAPEESE